MADITSHSVAYGGFRATLDRVFSSIGESMNTYMETKSRRPQVDALEAKTDEELAQLGIKRENIALHVFRDVLYV